MRVAERDSCDDVVVVPASEIFVFHGNTVVDFLIENLGHPGVENPAHG